MVIDKNNIDKLVNKQLKQSYIDIQNKFDTTTIANTLEYLQTMKNNGDIDITTRNTNLQPVRSTIFSSRKNILFISRTNY